VANESAQLSGADAPRPPWPLAVAAVISFVALSIAGFGLVVPLLLVPALLGVYVFDARLESAWKTWAIRVTLFAAIFAAAVARSKTAIVMMWVFDPQYIYPFGQLCAAELVLQCWRQRPSTGKHTPVFVLLSGIVLACAGGTFIRWPFLSILGPIYFLFMILGVGRLRAAPRPGSVALVVALVLGATTAITLYAFRNELTWLVFSLVQRGDRGETMWVAYGPRLGPTSNLRGSGRRVLRVEGARSEQRLRGAAHCRYWNGQWGPEPAERHDEVPTELRLPAKGPRQRITRRVDDTKIFFLPLESASFVPPDGVDVYWDRERSAPIYARGAAPAPCVYEVVTGPGAAYQGPLCQPLSKESRARGLRLPNDLDPRVRDLARQIAGQLSKPADRAQAVEKYLRANHEYSLSTDPGPGDPVTNFLLQKKAAHCEYFASATVILLRCLDVPSRLVTGYLAHEPAGPGAMVVRERDAHAWTECYIEGQGWITVDATPPAGLPDAMGQVSAWRRKWDAVEDGYDAFMAWLAGLHWFELSGLAAAAVALYFGIRLLRRRWSERRQRRVALAARAYTPPGERLEAMRAQFEAWLHRCGFVCPEHRTWEEFLTAHRNASTDGAQPNAAQVLDHSEPRASASGSPDRSLTVAARNEQALAFVREYNAVRFGSPDDASALARLEAALDEISAQR
jgi:transglutaminase-like putative cysteine protease